MAQRELPIARILLSAWYVRMGPGVSMQRSSNINKFMWRICETCARLLNNHVMGHHHLTMYVYSQRIVHHIAKFKWSHVAGV